MWNKVFHYNLLFPNLLKFHLCKLQNFYVTMFFYFFYFPKSNMFPCGIIFSSVSIGAVLRVMKPLLVSAPANSPGYRAFSADLCTACRCKMTFVLLWFVLMSGSAVISVAVRLLLMALEAVERATGGRISWYSRSVKSNSGPGTLLMLREETLTRFGSWRPSLCNL